MKIKLLKDFVATLIGMLLSGGLIANSAQLKFTTYNLGLAYGFVFYAEERLQPLSEMLAKHDSDVLCLQEVWTKEDRERIKAALAKNYPYVFEVEDNPMKTDSAPSCGIFDLFGKNKFLSCMTGSCGGLDGDQKVDCILKKCGKSLEALKTSNSTCAKALFAQVGKGTVSALWSVLNPFKSADTFAYGGSSGLLLFSKLKLENQKVLDFAAISTTNRRAVLLADIEVPNGLKSGNQINGSSVKTTLGCMHLTANLDGHVPYAGKWGSWQKESEFETSELLKKVSEDPRVILLGDFNSGPEIRRDDKVIVKGDFESNYKMFEDAKFVSPVAMLDPPECSFCPSNGLTEEKDGILIDHVLFKGFGDGRVFQSKIVFNENADLNISKPEAKKIQSPLSDHYGVQVTADLSTQKH